MRSRKEPPRDRRQRRTSGRGEQELAVRQPFLRRACIGPGDVADKRLLLLLLLLLPATAAGAPATLLECGQVLPAKVGRTARLGALDERGLECLVGAELRKRRAAPF
jgi:hypothetical protein